jgi:hypothetical protein
MGPRSANPKFQAGVTLNGIPLVEDRLRALMFLNAKLETRDGQPLLTSVHVLHEVKTRNPSLARYNSPSAIHPDKLMSGIRRGKFPRILAVTAPAFGFKGAQNGGILAEDDTMAFELHEEALNLAEKLKEDGLGEGVVIWWPSFDSRRMNVLEPINMRRTKRMSAKELVSVYLELSKDRDTREAREMLKDFWIRQLQSGGEVHLEWKSVDPGDLDYICTLGQTITFCDQINNALGRTAMFINNEWAHLLCSGKTVLEGTKETHEEGLFSGFLHCNSARLMPVSVSDQLESGKAPNEIVTSFDEDWAVGMGGRERWDDQAAAVKYLETCGVETIFAEHDINPAGNDPLAYAAFSIGNFEKMLAS